jgi:hypothetical protein
MYSAKYSVEYGIKVTKQQVVDEANSIWKHLRSLKIKDNENALDAFFSKQFDEHRDIYKAYPVAMRFMWQSHLYNEESFSKHVDAVSAVATSCTEEQYLQLQSDYVVDLHRHIYKYKHAGFFNKLRDQTMATLRGEVEEYRKEVAIAEAKAKEQTEKFAKMNRESLKEYISDLHRKTLDTPESRDELFIAKAVYDIGGANTTTVISNDNSGGTNSTAITTLPFESADSILSDTLP